MHTIRDILWGRSRSRYRSQFRITCYFWTMNFTFPPPELPNLWKYRDFQKFLKENLISIEFSWGITFKNFQKSNVFNEFGRVGVLQVNLVKGFLKVSIWTHYEAKNIKRLRKCQLFLNGDMSTEIWESLLIQNWDRLRANLIFILLTLSLELFHNFTWKCYFYSWHTHPSIKLQNL